MKNNTAAINVKMIHVLQIVVLLLIVVGVYWKSLNNDFTLDDPLVTTLNVDLNSSSSSVATFFNTSLYHGSPLESGNKNLYRPLLKVSLAFNKWLSNNLFDSFRFHAMNLVLYGVLIVLLFYLYKRLFIRMDKPWLPFMATLIFAIFPAHTEVVCSIKHREEMLAAMFLVASWLAFMKYQHKKWVAGLFFLLSLLSKESALMFFPAIFLFDLYLNEKEFKGKFFEIKSYIKFYPFFVAVIVYLSMRWNALGTFTSPDKTGLFFYQDENILTRLLVTGQIYWKYYIWDQRVRPLNDGPSLGRISVV